jgi:hypothetical protein
MKVGLTAARMDEPLVRLQLLSMLEAGCPPDFLIQHSGSFAINWDARLRHYRQLLKEHRLTAPLRLLRQIGHRSPAGGPDPVPVRRQAGAVSLSEEQISRVESLIRSVPVHLCADLNGNRGIRLIEAHAPCLVVCNSGILRERVLAVPGAVFLNVHVSKLPRYRGVNNVEWALWHGDPLFATIHAISPGIDEGNVLLQERLELSGFRPASIAEYRELSFWSAYSLVGKAVSGYRRGELSFVEQPHRGLPLMQYYVMHPILRAALDARLAAKEP